MARYNLKPEKHRYELKPRKSKRSFNSEKSLTDIGISAESAKLATFQYEYLSKVDKKVAEEYQRQVSDTVTGLKERLLNFYRDKIEDDQDIDFLENDYIPMILQNNLNAIIRSFDENFGGLLADNEEYRDMRSDVTISSILTRADSKEGISYLKDTISSINEQKQERQSMFGRIKESVTAFFGKSKTQTTTAQRGTVSKAATKRQGIFSRAVSAIKSLFGRVNDGSN